MGKLEGFLQLSRPLNCLMMGFAVIVGASLVSPLTFSFSHLLGFITSFTLTGASMAINDYHDREIDIINEPSRPIPSGSINPKEALFFAFILSLIGFVAAFKTNVSCFIVAVFAWIASITYNTKGKRTGLPGNFLVSACVATPFIYGGFVAEKPELPIILFAAMAFLLNTGREVTKGIADVEGDESQNIKTVAVLYGERKAAVASSFFSLLAVSLTPLPWLRGLVSNWFIPFIIITDIGLIVSSISLLRDYSRKNARKAKNMSLIWFTTALLALVAGNFG